MEKRYDDRLMACLETVMDRGYCQLYWTELQRWYGKQKIAARTFRDIQQRWADLKGDENARLTCIRHYKHSWVLLDSERVVPFSDDE